MLIYTGAKRKNFDNEDSYWNKLFLVFFTRIHSFTLLWLNSNDCVPREWVRDMWNGWFDQVFPPTPSESEDEEPEYQPDEPVSQTREEKEKEKKRYTFVFSDM